MEREKHEGRGGKIQGSRNRGRKRIKEDEKGESTLREFKEKVERRKKGRRKGKKGKEKVGDIKDRKKKDKRT